jgi:aryl-alcohol dehydrogenase-like predicted oxidoreductase
MEYQRLGLTDLKISRIGFGCWAIGGHGYGKVQDTESIAAIQKALDLGINFFDTADVYGFGHSEEILGKALGSHKNKVVIATKFGVNWDDKGNTFYDCSPKRVTEALEASLRRLKVDCIQLYQVHWYDKITPIYDSLEALKKCQKAGKIKHFGCSNIPLSYVYETSKAYRIESLQYSYNISHINLEENIIQCSKLLKISIIAYNVLGRGLFSGKYSSHNNFEERDTRPRDKNFQGEKLRKNLALLHEIKSMCSSYNKTPSQFAIRWVLDNENVTCALVGIKNLMQLEENMGALGWTISKEDVALFKKGRNSKDNIIE